MKRLIFIFFMFLLLLSGCLKSLPIDQYCYVIDIGVERGERLPYLVTLLINSPAAGSGESESTGEVAAVTAEGRSLFEAIETLSAGMANEFNFSRVSLLTFSRDLAHEGEIEELMNIALGKLKIRANTRVMIVESDVKAMLEGAVSASDPSTGKLKIKVENAVLSSGMVVDIKWSELKEAFESKTHDALVGFCAVNESEIRAVDMAGGDEYPYFGGSLLIEGELKTTIMGSAVFADDRMVGILDGQNTMLVQIATGAFSKGRIRLSYGNGKELSVMLYKDATPRLSLEKDRVSFHIELNADIEMPEIMENAKAGELEALVQEYLRERLINVFKATRDAGADVFGVGKAAIKEFDSAGDWEAYDWKGRFSQLQASFTIAIRIGESPDDIALE
ncbi:MAG: Ger(x)C family spore germination C-terminal domain-containing protein [Clostridia bacterium]|nr:Ger(x)C family spore germination C-terminal domain-containing protein [Clostridia bacterium]